MNHFDNPTPEVKALRERVLAWLEAGAPETQDFGIAGFDMITVSRRTDPMKGEPACGTMCCIAGAALQFSGLHARHGTMEDAADLLGVEDYKTHHFREQMFLGGNLYLKDITPTMAADTFRRWIETGNITWEKA